MNSYIKTYGDGKSYIIYRVKFSTRSLSSRNIKTLLHQ